VPLEVSNRGVVDARQSRRQQARPSSGRVQNAVGHSHEISTPMTFPESGTMLRTLAAYRDRMSKTRHELQIGTIQLEREGLRSPACAYSR
jgi:hypothetical protein